MTALHIHESNVSWKSSLVSNHSAVSSSVVSASDSSSSSSALSVADESPSSSSMFSSTSVSSASSSSSSSVTSYGPSSGFMDNPDTGDTLASHNHWGSILNKVY